MMNFLKWKTFFLTCGACLLSILPGLFLWGTLPDTIAIHFNIHNQPDNFAPKAFVVFGLPLLMMLFQGFCCFMTDLTFSKHGGPKRFEMITKWILPFVTFAMELATLGFSLGRLSDIRKIVAIIVGIMFILIGNYLPKLDFIKNYKIKPEKTRKINRFMGFETVIMGLLFLVSSFLPPFYTIFCLFLMIPYAIITLIYFLKQKK